MASTTTGSVTCDEAAQALTEDLGFSCLDVNPVISLNAPTDLYSWTQPALEVLVIAGALLALAHGVRRLRVEGDPTNLSLWFASLAYLAVTEPPLYFPEWFGLDRVYGFIFAHNEFTVQFMYDRLPLYIVAIYPMLTALGYEAMRVMGVFRRFGPLVGCVGVAFVAQVFYEIFDHLGPQLRWWAWNPDNDIVNQPALASVPMTSMLLFASVSLGFLTYLVVRLVGPAPGRSRLSVVLRTLLAGALTPLGMLVAGVPSSLFGGDTPNVTAQTWVIGVELALVWIAGLWIIAQVWRADPAHDPVPLNRFIAVYPAVFLAAFAVFWLTALPEYVAATDGLTEAGTPIGSGWYVAACFLGAGLVIATLHRDRLRGRNAGVGATRTPETLGA